MNALWLLGCASLLSAPLFAATLTPADFLNEITHRDALARTPAQAYTTKMFSSYSRASTAENKIPVGTPGVGGVGIGGWFDNADNNNFIRIDDVGGIKHYVLMDEFGPGVITRFWVTFSGTRGSLNIYLDGATEPTYTGSALELIGEGILVPAPLSDSVADVSPRDKRGHNLYMPISYGTHCKITYTCPVNIEQGVWGDAVLYYNMEARTYTDGTVIETLTPEHLAAIKDNAVAVANTTLTGLGANALVDQVGVVNASATLGELAPNTGVQLDLTGSQAIRKLHVKLAAGNLNQALRSTVLSISFDGAETVWAPVGDFFGTGYQVHAYETYYTKVSADGTMEAYWVMPFETSATVKLHNYGDQDVTIEAFNVDSNAWMWDMRSMHFGAGWREYRKIPASWSAPRDVNYATLTGQGLLVGSSVALYNTVGNWWGEGDEKIYVDGVDFPQFFGTGTEDYYGYAWCLSGIFNNHPFLAQPIGAGNNSANYTVNNRYRALDAIPFTTSLTFDMEIYSYQGEGVINYAPVTQWYMLPGGTNNLGTATAENVAAVRQPVAMSGADVIKPDPITEGRIEGEHFSYTNTNGEAGPQDYADASVKKHLFWKGGSVGATLTVTVPIAQAGYYDLDLDYVVATDFAIYQVSANGIPLGDTIDAYAVLGIAEKTLTNAYFVQGDNTLTFTIMGKNAANTTNNNCVSLDCVDIAPAINPPVATNVTVNAINKTTWSSLWTESVQWINHLDSVATVTGVGDTFTFDKSIVANTLSITGGSTTFNQMALTSLAGTLNLTGMTGGATFNGVAVSSTLPVVFDPGTGKTLAINDAAMRITGHGGMEFVSGTSTVTLNNTDNAGGRYTATGSKTILNIDTKVNDSYGSFKNNPWGVFTYRVTEGGTLVFTGVNPMGHGAPYNNDSGVGFINNGTVRSTAAHDVVISGIQSIAKSSTATFDNASPSAGLIYNGATFDLATGATVNFTGSSLRFRPQQMPGKHVKIRLAEGSTVNATAPTIIDYCIGGQKGLWITGPGAVNFSSISDGWINIEKEVGDTAAPTFSATGLVNSHVSFCDGTTFDLSTLEGPLALSNVNATAATDTLNLELGTRKVSAGTQLVTWTGTFDTKPIVQIVRKGVPDVDTNVVVKGNSIDVSSSILDAASVATWTELNTSTVSGDVILANVGNAFDFNTELSVTSLTLRGGNDTTFTNSASVTASDLWDLSAMTGNVSFGVTPVTTKIFRIGAAGVSPPLNILGTTDPDTPLYLKAKIEGDAGLNFTGHSKLELSGNQNAGGHYTVSGADTSLTIHNTDSYGVGNFDANTWGVLTFDVLDNATLAFSGSNPMGWGDAHGDESVIATIDNGTVKSTGGAQDMCILGGYTVRGTSYFTNENSEYGLIWHDSTFNITPGATMIANGAADGVAGRNIRVRTHTTTKRNLFALADGATLDLQLPLVIDGNYGASHGMHVIGSGTLKTTSIAGGRLTLATKDGATLNGVLTDFTCADTGPALFVSDTMHATNLHIVGKASIDISQRAVPLSMGILSTVTDRSSTLMINVGERTLNANDQLLAWSTYSGSLSKLTIVLSNGKDAVMTKTGLFVIESTEANTADRWSGLGLSDVLPVGAKVLNMASVFDFDRNINTATIALSSAQSTTFTNVTAKTLSVENWDFSGMQDAVFWCVPSIASDMLIKNAGDFLLTGTDDPASPQRIDARVIGSSGRIIAESGFSHISFKGVNNAGGSYIVKDGASLTLQANANDALGIFKDNLEGRTSFEVQTGGKLTFKGDNHFGNSEGREYKGVYMGAISGTLARDTGTIELIGTYNTYGDVTIDNGAADGTFVLHDTLINVSGNLTLTGKALDVYKSWRWTDTGWYWGYPDRYAKISLESGATFTVNAPINMMGNGQADNEQAVYMDVFGAENNVVTITSVDSTKTAAALSLGAHGAHPAPTLVVCGTPVTDPDTGAITYKTMDHVDLAFLEWGRIDFTDPTLPMLVVKGLRRSNEAWTLRINVTGRRFTEDVQLMKWGATDYPNDNITFEGVPSGVTLEVRDIEANVEEGILEQKGIFAVVADPTAYYVADAQEVAMGLADTANLAWNKPWADSVDNDATFKNLGTGFTFDKDFTARRVYFFGDRPTTISQTAGTAAVGAWDFSGLREGGMVDIATISATEIKVGNRAPVTFVGSSSIEAPQTIKTTMKGGAMGGGIVIGSGFTKLTLDGIENNEGGTYTVKSGAYLQFASSANHQYGAFATSNNRGTFSYEVESGATLEFITPNSTGWTARDLTTLSGTIAGELVFKTLGFNTCITGRNRIVGTTAKMTNSVDNGGMLFLDSLVEIAPHAKLTLAGTQFTCMKETRYGRGDVFADFLLSKGATLDCTTELRMSGIAGVPSYIRVRGDANSTVIVKDVVRGSTLGGPEQVASATLNLAGPTLKVTGTMATAILNLEANGRISLAGRSTEITLGALTSSTATVAAPHTLTIDMAGYTGNLYERILSWGGTKPLNISFIVINADKADVIVGDTGITLGKQYSVTIDGGDQLSTDIMTSLQNALILSGLPPDAYQVSAQDATASYALGLTGFEVVNAPLRVDAKTRVALDYRFKVIEFVITGEDLADLTCEVAYNNVNIVAEPPVLNGNYAIHIMGGDVLQSDGYTSVKQSDEILTALDKEVVGYVGSRVTVRGVPLNGKTFFKARVK